MSTSAVFTVEQNLVVMLYSRVLAA